MTVDIPVAQQRRGLDFQHCCLWWRVMGFLDAFCVMFRAPPVVPELSASFSSFRVLTTVSARGLLAISFQLLSGSFMCGQTHMLTSFPKQQQHTTTTTTTTTTQHHHNTTQHNTTQHNTTQHNTTQQQDNSTTTQQQ